MNKRQFLAPFAVALLSRITLPRSVGADTQGSNMIKAAGVTFAWHHANHRLVATMTASTSGWIAVGFNTTPGLRNTRFVIADVASHPVRAEEHLALVPAHPEISDLGLTPALTDVRGSFRSGRSQLSFSMAHNIPGPPPLDLTPGRINHLMLAWSHQRAFDHHSAWRQHFEITL